MSVFNLIAVLVFVAVGAGLVAWHRLKQKRTLQDILRGGDSGTEQQETEPEQEGESFLDRFERLALQAGLGWTRSLYYYCAGVGAALGTALALSGHGAAGLLLFAAGVAGPFLYVVRARNARSEQFARQLPQALFLAASVLRAGGTLLQAVDAIAAEMPAPMGTEFKTIQQQMRLQVPAHEAMAQAQARVGVREFAAVVVAARITMEVGGNLAHVYDQVARSIVDAQNARRTIAAFTTEGRMSANLIAALPFVVLGLLQVMSPGYFGILLADWTGRAVLIACLGTIALGWYTIRRMVDIRIF